MRPWDAGNQLAKMNAECATGAIGLSNYRPPTVMERLQERRIMLQKQLNEVDDAIKSLEAQPGVADVLEKLANINI